MKSVMEEASSLTKAIENGWERAGKPREFTIKVLQKPEKNFFGFTTKSAKIALLFDEKTVEIKRKEIKEYVPKKRIIKKQQIKKQPELTRPPKKVQKTSPQKIWSTERSAFVQQWINAMLTMLNRSDIKFQTSIDRAAIRFTFDKPLLEDSEKEKQLFRSWAYLIIQTIRHTYKQQFRNIKVILKSSS